MAEAGVTLLAFLREAWTALAGALLAFAILAMLAQVLKVSSAGVLGANLWVWEAVSAVIAVLALGLFGFLGVPQIIQGVEAAIPSGAGCGPISELGGLSAAIIGGLAGITWFLGDGANWHLLMVCMHLYYLTTVEEPH